MSGYSGTPLAKKLGIKAGMTVVVLDAPKSYKETLGELPEEVAISAKEQAGADIIHVFITESTDLKRLITLKKLIKKDGAVWVSWPKKSSGVKTDLTEDVIRNFALQNGLVDVKVCAFDDIWSCLKLVYRLKDR